MSAPLLTGTGLHCGYGGAAVLRGVDLAIGAGSVVGIVGANGAGKSTLLRSLHGGMRPASGVVRFGPHDLAALPRSEIAKRIAVVPQVSWPAFPLRVDAFVALGRFAHERRFAGSSARDREVVRASLSRLGLDAFAGRGIDELSGGEYRRVLLAQALVQEPQVLLLDEPIQQLDLRHQLLVLGFVREFAALPGRAVVMVLHELDMAARSCDELVLLHDGKVLAAGSPERVLTPESLEIAYGVRATVTRSAATGALQVIPLAPAPPAPTIPARCGPPFP